MSGEEEVDYTTLPLEERLTYKLWKARLEAYKELNQLLETPLATSVGMTTYKFTGGILHYLHNI